jgi:hypothetical protein
MVYILSSCGGVEAFRFPQKLRRQFFVVFAMEFLSIYTINLPTSGTSFGTFLDYTQARHDTDYRRTFENPSGVSKGPPVTLIFWRRAPCQV